MLELVWTCYFGACLVVGAFVVARWQWRSFLRQWRACNRQIARAKAAMRASSDRRRDVEARRHPQD